MRIGQKSDNRARQSLESPEVLRGISEVFLENATRFYRLAQTNLDPEVREELLELAREFEERAKAARERALR